MTKEQAKILFAAHADVSLYDPVNLLYRWNGNRNPTQDEIVNLIAEIRMKEAEAMVKKFFPEG